VEPSSMMMRQLPAGKSSGRRSRSAKRRGTLSASLNAGTRKIVGASGAIRARLKTGVATDGVSAAGYASALIDALLSSQVYAGSSTPLRQSTPAEGTAV